MPTYNFQCKKCEHYYRELTDWDSTGKYKDVVCPKCGSKRKEQQATACDFMFNQPIGTDRWNNGTHGHGYRYEYNKPNVAKQRAAALAAAKGEEVYKHIDDTNNDRNFDFSRI